MTTEEDFMTQMQIHTNLLESLISAKEVYGATYFKVVNNELRLVSDPKYARSAARDLKLLLDQLGRPDLNSSSVSAIISEQLSTELQHWKRANAVNINIGNRRSAFQRIGKRVAASLSELPFMVKLLEQESQDELGTPVYLVLEHIVRPGLRKMERPLRDSTSSIFQSRAQQWESVPDGTGVRDRVSAGAHRLLTDPAVVTEVQKRFRQLWSEHVLAPVERFLEEYKPTLDRAQQIATASGGPLAI
jgi:hypothetical protein